MKKYFSVIMFAIALLFAPAFTKAATIEELQTSITELQIMISQLDALVATETVDYSIFTPFKMSCPSDYHAYWQIEGIDTDICNSIVDISKIDEAGFISN